ncbi:uncharacterized protein MYCGRDRAFT_94733 [Zymoseptoria tritici IPO323]|uniref:Uncharacterized protein n=1 Tax=Zymoseptoria tritici (strain CBS 115943 / IPO323) TaxID=336722 RepID=F9XEU9_ZYMTI|nr:uncharacterized protein MYCGRDRAFT_94733 [Zymoseptoria tritici IPO323]EGP85837.1 hypothetical protein MYCGRDRAFT_94733 [Zymoseptoria tritici IPO323]
MAQETLHQMERDHIRLSQQYLVASHEIFHDVYLQEPGRVDRELRSDLAYPEIARGYFQQKFCPSLVESPCCIVASMAQTHMDDLHIPEHIGQYQFEAALCLIEEEQGTFRLHQDGKPRFTPRQDPEMQQWLDQYGFLCQYMIDLRNGVATSGAGIDFEVVTALTAYVEDAGNVGEVLEYLSERWLPARARVADIEITHSGRSELSSLTDDEKLTLFVTIANWGTISNAPLLGPRILRIISKVQADASSQPAEATIFRRDNANQVMVVLLQLLDRRESSIRNNINFLLSRNIVPGNDTIDARQLRKRFREISQYIHFLTTAVIDANFVYEVAITSLEEFNSWLREPHVLLLRQHDQAVQRDAEQST